MGTLMNSTVVVWNADKKRMVLVDLVETTFRESHSTFSKDLYYEKHSLQRLLDMCA